MADKHHEYYCQHHEQRAVNEQSAVGDVVHDKSGKSGSYRLRGHCRHVIVTCVLTDRGFRREFDDHGEGIDVCDNESEARYEIEQRKQNGRHNRVVAGTDKSEYEQEGNDRHAEAYHNRLTSADFGCKVADGNKRYCADTHTDARDNRRDACGQVEFFGRVDGKV